MSRSLTQLRESSITALLPLVAFVVLISLLPTPPHDLFWHMRVGKLIAETGQIPSTNLFSWGMPTDTPYFYGAWLSELLLYWLYRLGGLELLVCTRNLMAGALLGLVLLEARRRGCSWRHVALAVTVAALLAINNMAVRPQMFAWIPFGLMVLLLGGYGEGRLRTWTLLACSAGLMAIWVNLHGSFVLGMALAGGVLVGEMVDRWRNPDTGMCGRRLAGLALTVPVMALATLANPRGIDIYHYVTTLLRDVPTQRYISEWQPPAPTGLVNGVFFASVLLLMVVCAYQRPSPRARDIALVCGFLWLAWHGGRYVVWYGIIAAPILAAGVAQLLATRPGRKVKVAEREQTPRRPPRWALAALVGMLLVPVVWVQPWFGQAPRLLINTPIQATDYLSANPGGRLFSASGYASYLIWAIPEQPVFMDTRLEMYPVQLVEDYLAISVGARSLELLDQYGIDKVLLHRDLQKGLSATLAASGTWQREYDDEEAEIWRRNGRSRFG